MPTRREALIAGLSAATVGYVGAIMSDRPDFQRSQDIADQSLPEQDTAVTTERSRDIKSLNKRPSSNVPDQSGEDVTFRPPAGSVFELRAVFVDIELTGGSGRHSIVVTTEDNDFGPVLRGVLPGGTKILIEGNVLANTGSAVSFSPQTETGQIQACQTIAADNNQAIQFTYFNSTGQTNIQPRSYTVLVDQIDVD
jgi:hypothetical protein